jgi:hypothetical protein
LSIEEHRLAVTAAALRSTVHKAMYHAPQETLLKINTAPEGAV